MITKGVASVRSPVCNLQQFSSSISHETFSVAVVKAFREEYNIDEEPQVFGGDGVISSIEYIRQGMAELPSWEWAYGQTPEFVYSIKNSFAWGDVIAEIKSKHGVILSCSISHEGVDDSKIKQELIGLGQALEKKMFGFVHDAVLETNIVGAHSRDVWSWLRTVMNS